MKTSLQGRNLIIRAEGFRSDAYLCSAGIPTIGFGSIRYMDREPVQLGDTISREDAEELLTHYIATNIDPIIPRLIPRPLTQPQWDAFASFLYNFGFEKTRGYTLTKLIAEGPKDNSLEALRAWEADIIHWWPVYRMAGGKALLGLYRRRVAELLTFLHLPSDVAWTLPHMGVDLNELVANLRAGKKPVTEPKLAPPPPAPEPVILDTPLPPPEPVTVQEAPPAALPKETPMSAETAPATKHPLQSSTIWGIVILAMVPQLEGLAVAFGQIGEQVSGPLSGIFQVVGLWLGIAGRFGASVALAIPGKK